jgi:hypothetical protein
VPRTFTFRTLVKLPRLDTSSALTLGAELLSLSKANKRLPRAIVKASSLLARRLSVLRDATALRLPSGKDTSRKSAADRAIDTAWSGLFDWLTGWSKLPAYLPQARDAAALRCELFPDGLKFTLLPHKLEWAESDARLMRIRKARLDAAIRRLGGFAFLDALRTAHKEFGDALGVTAPPAPPAPSRNVRAALDDFGFALRAYVVKVTAHIDDDRPETKALARELLAPLEAWQSPEVLGS